MDVIKVATLARLEITPEEAERFQGQLEQVLAHVEQLEKVDVSEIEPTSHAVPVFDVIRDDASIEDHRLTAAEALSNAPEESHDQFKVVKVVE